MAKSQSNISLQIGAQRIYSYWQAIVLSFFSQQLYWDVYKRWRGVGFLYLLLMISLFSIPYGIKTTLGMRHFFKEKLIAPIHRLPDISYVDGDLVFDKKMPYYITDDKGQVETIIDNTGAYKQFERSKYPALKFLFINNKVLFSMPEAADYLTALKDREPPKVNNIDVPKDVNLVFNGDWFLKQFQIDNLRKITLAAIYPVVATSFYFVSIIFLLPLAMMGQIISQTIFKVHLYYKQSCRLLTVATTPAFFALQVMALGQYYQQYIGFVWLGLMAMYFSFALIILKRNLRSIARL